MGIADMMDDMDRPAVHRVRYVQHVHSKDGSGSYSGGAWPVPLSSRAVR